MKKNIISLKFVITTISIVLALVLVYLVSFGKLNFLASENIVSLSNISLGLENCGGLQNLPEYSVNGAFRDNYIYYDFGSRDVEISNNVKVVSPVKIIANKITIKAGAVLDASGTDAFNYSASSQKFFKGTAQVGIQLGLGISSANTKPDGSASFDDFWVKLNGTEIFRDGFDEYPVWGNSENCNGSVCWEQYYIGTEKTAYDGKGLKISISDCLEYCGGIVGYSLSRFSSTNKYFPIENIDSNVYEFGIGINTSKLNGGIAFARLVYYDKAGNILGQNEETIGYFAKATPTAQDAYKIFSSTFNNGGRQLVSDGGGRIQGNNRSCSLGSGGGGGGRGVKNGELQAFGGAPGGYDAEFGKPGAVAAAADQSAKGGDGGSGGANSSGFALGGKSELVQQDNSNSTTVSGLGGGGGKGAVFFEVGGGGGGGGGAISSSTSESNGGGGGGGGGSAIYLMANDLEINGDITTKGGKGNFPSSDINYNFGGGGGGGGSAIYLMANDLEINGDITTKGGKGNFPSSDINYNFGGGGGGGGGGAIYLETKNSDGKIAINGNLSSAGGQGATFFTNSELLSKNGVDGADGVIKIRAYNDSQVSVSSAATIRPLKIFEKIDEVASQLKISNVSFGGGTVNIQWDLNFDTNNNAQIPEYSLKLYQAEGSKLDLLNNQDSKAILSEIKNNPSVYINVSEKVISNINAAALTPEPGKVYTWFVVAEISGGNPLIDAVSRPFDRNMDTFGNIKNSLTNTSYPNLKPVQLPKQTPVALVWDAFKYDGVSQVTKIVIERQDYENGVQKTPFRPIKTLQNEELNFISWEDNTVSYSSPGLNYNYDYRIYYETSIGAKSHVSAPVYANPGPVNTSISITSINLTNYEQNNYSDMTLEFRGTILSGTSDYVSIALSDFGINEINLNDVVVSGDKQQNLKTTLSNLTQPLIISLPSSIQNETHLIIKIKNLTNPSAVGAHKVYVSTSKDVQEVEYNIDIIQSNTTVIVTPRKEFDVNFDGTVDYQDLAQAITYSLQLVNQNTPVCLSLAFPDSENCKAADLVGNNNKILIDDLRYLFNKLSGS